MIIFIFGEDLYQSQKRLKELKDKFKEKYGDINISIFDIDKKEAVNAPKIISEIESMPFLGTKRLIIIKNIITCGETKIKEKLGDKLASIPESSIVIFYEKGTPRKNDKLFKSLMKLAKVESFPHLRGFNLVNWIKKEVTARGGEIEPSAAEKLALFIGNDTLRINCEIEKLINFAHPQVITADEINLLVAATTQVKIFDLVDNLAQRDGRLALKSLHQLLVSGEKDLYLLSMMAYGFRNLILIKYLSQKNKKTGESDLARNLGLHPFVLKKSLSASKSFSFLELKKIYHKILEANQKIRETDNDPALVLNLLVSEICVR